MQRYFKRAVSLLLALVFVLAAFAAAPFTVSAAESYSGAAGDLTWVLSGDGVLTISGSGAMPDYGYPYYNEYWGIYNDETPIAPWLYHTNSDGFNENICYKIISVVIEEGVTSVGDNAFFDCSELKEVSFPSTLQTIGSYAFNAGRLSNLIIPAGVNYIKDYAFSGSGAGKITILGAETSFGYCVFDQALFQVYQGSTADSYLTGLLTDLGIEEEYIADYISYLHPGVTVTFDPCTRQKGQGTAFTVNADDDGSVIMPEQPEGFSNTLGLTFAGWTNGYSDGCANSILYRPGTKQYFTNGYTLYAVWKLTVEFYYDGALYSSTDWMNYFYYGLSLPIPVTHANLNYDGVVPLGYTFTGYKGTIGGEERIVYAPGYQNQLNIASNEIRDAVKTQMTQSEYPDGVFKVYAVIETETVEEPSISIDETKTLEPESNNYSYLRFVPNEDMTIIFSGNNDDNNYIEIVVCNHNKETINVTSRTGYGNARTEYDVNKDTVYYLAARFYYSDHSGSAITVSLKQKLPIEPPEVLGETVELDSVIRLNFYVDTKGNESIWPSISMNDNDIDQYVSTDVGDGKIKYSIPINAKEMTDAVSISMSYYDEDYDYHTTEPVEKTVKEYLEALINNEDSSDALKDLCCATLNYGAAAQLQFGYKTDTLANADIDYTTPAYGSDELPELGFDEGSQADYSDIGMTYYASSIGLFADTAYAVCFEADSYDYNYLPWSYDAEIGNDRSRVGTVTWTDGKGEEHYSYLWAYYITDIAAKNLLDDYTVTFHKDYYDDNDEYQIYEKIVTFNPGTYIAKVMQNAGANPTYYEYGEEYDVTEAEAQLQTTVLALYDYAVKAKAFFG